MNTVLLRLARRNSRNGVRQWTVPGHGNAAKLIPSTVTPDGWGPSFRWPGVDPRDGAECVKGVCLWRHRAIARNAARALVAGCKQ